MKLKEKLEADKKITDDAHAVYIKAQRTYELIINPINAEHHKILNNIVDKQNAKIEAEQTCDCCSSRLYDSANFTKTGVRIRKDANHPNDIIDTELTWDQIEEALQGTKE